MYKRKQGLGGWAATIILALYCLIAVVLIGNMVMSSFKTKQDLLFNTFGLPKQFSLENYRQVLVKDSLYRNFFNSLFLVKSRLSRRYDGMACPLPVQGQALEVYSC